MVVSQVTQRYELIHTAEHDAFQQLTIQGLPAGLHFCYNPHGMGSTDVLVAPVHSRVVMRVRPSCMHVPAVAPLRPSQALVG